PPRAARTPPARPTAVDGPPARPASRIGEQTDPATGGRYLRRPRLRPWRDLHRLAPARQLRGRGGNLREIHPFLRQLFHEREIRLEPVLLSGHTELVLEERGAPRRHVGGAWHPYGRDPLARESLDELQQARLARRDEEDGGAGPPGASRAADAVHVRL